MWSLSPNMYHELFAENPSPPVPPAHMPPTSVTSGSTDARIHGRTHAHTCTRANKNDSTRVFNILRCHMKGHVLSEGHRELVVRKRVGAAGSCVCLCVWGVLLINILTTSFDIMLVLKESMNFRCHTGSMQFAGCSGLLYRCSGLLYRCQHLRMLPLCFWVILPELGLFYMSRQTGVAGAGPGDREADLLRITS